MIDHLAGVFESTEMPDTGWWQALWPSPRDVLVAVGVSSGMEVIDLCSGDGWFTLPIAKIARKVIAIDLDARLLVRSRIRLAPNEVTNCSFVAGNAYELAKLADHPVDYVFLANVLHGVPDKSRLARAVHDTLRRGGRFAIVNWHRRPREETIVLGEPRGPRTELRMSPEETFASVQPAGLDLLRVVELPPYHYGAIFARPRGDEK